MIKEYFGNAQANQTSTGSRMLLPLFLTLIFAMSFWPSKAQAQIIGNLEAEIPFQFNVGNTTLPAGRYVIHHLEGSDPSIMDHRLKRLLKTVDPHTAQLFWNPQVVDHRL